MNEFALGMLIGSIMGSFIVTAAWMIAIASSYRRNEWIRDMMNRRETL